MDKKIFNQYGSLSGFLKKKQGMISFASEERFFKIVNGKNIAYSEKENTELKGIIEIHSIKKIETKNNDKNFKIIYPKKDYDLGAPSEEIKNKWVTAILELRKEIFRIKSGEILSEEEINNLQGNEEGKEKDKKNWKVKCLDRDTFDVKNK